MTRRPPSPEERVYRALFGGYPEPLARPVVIWPNERKKILAAIRKALAEPKRRKT